LSRVRSNTGLPLLGRLHNVIQKKRKRRGRLSGYEDFLPPGPDPEKRADANGETGGVLFCLFLSAFGFFFSRLLLI